MSLIFKDILSELVHILDEQGEVLATQILRNALQEDVSLCPHFHTVSLLIVFKEIQSCLFDQRVELILVLVINSVIDTGLDNQKYSLIWYVDSG